MSSWVSPPYFGVRIKSILVIKGTKYKRLILMICNLSANLQWSRVVGTLSSNLSAVWRRVHWPLPKIVTFTLRSYIKVFEIFTIFAINMNLDQPESDVWIWKQFSIKWHFAIFNTACITYLREPAYVKVNSYFSINLRFPQMRDSFV